jgi:hypothetical protein
MGCTGCGRNPRKSRMAAMAEPWSVVKTFESPLGAGASEGDGVATCVWACPKGTVFAANINRPAPKTAMTSHLPLSFKARMPQVESPPYVQSEVEAPDTTRVLPWCKWANQKQSDFMSL